MFKDSLVKANFICNLFYSLSFPVVQKILITSITDKYIALNSIIACFCTIILGYLWNKYGDRFYNFYGILLLLEVLFYGALTVSVLFNLISFKFYYVAETLLFSLITKNIIFGGNKLKSLIYSKNRNEFDNNQIIASNISSLVGLSICFIFNISTTMAFIFMFLGLSTDNIYYLKAFKENKINNI